jgi:hypothetical protein
MQIERSREMLLKGNFENKMEKVGKGHGAQMSVRRQILAYFRIFLSSASCPNSFLGSPTFPSGGHLEFFIVSAVPRERNQFIHL